ncbi:MAG: TldD/PmbA family protein [Actinomycetes bacterium]
MSGAGDIEAIARRVVDAATGAEGIEVRVSRSRETEVDILHGAVEALTVAGSEGISVRVVVDGRVGVASAGSLDPDIVADVLADARDNARFAEPDEFAGLATPAEIGDVPVAALDLWREDVLATPTADKVVMALELERALAGADARIRGVESAGYGDSAVESVLLSTTGIEARVRRTSASMSASALAGPEDGTQTGYGFTRGRAVGDLDPGSVVTDAVLRSTRLLGATQPTTQRVPVVLDPLVARSVISLWVSAMSAESVQKGRSMFAERLGERIAPEFVDLVEDPTDPDAPGAAPFDSEGVPTRRVDLVRAGVLAAFLHDVTTARRGGTVTTGSSLGGGPGARATSLRPGARGQAEIVASLPLGLYVQSISGIHSGTSTASGDFSVGATGLMIRDGAFAEPIREATIASTLPRMLLDLAEVGADRDWMRFGGASTLLIGEMMLSGA